MNRLPVDPEEMARRHDEDYIASLKMVGEGAPIFSSCAEEAKEHLFQDQQLPETYQ
ncbi:hypothetical protein JSQ81_11130 [Sporosarcina sp. Marseille-Q4063]|uniref:hypothetical protein n=1 Tax=Sporosarcina sp. Marseille-Q4063 TaxID=2810514 RepID=UPI001BAFC763|nr:hypothetical protein [Sporosarcina sp. Marseille-Q4063]QUW20416.1 hypothetical protein JSQ81_11130 [Sporosarcina sp. Marseille-Q4063]